MGTNFYAETRRREPGLLSEITWTTLHIGKRFGAGGGLLSFCFQAHHLPDGELDSWTKWKNTLVASRTKILVDEYGIEWDADNFIAFIESITPANRRKQFDIVAEQGCPTTTYDDPDKGTNEYLCPDGFSFTYAEFT